MCEIKNPILLLQEITNFLPSIPNIYIYRYTFFILLLNFFHIVVKLFSYCCQTFAAKTQHRCGDNKVKCESDEDIVIIVNVDHADDKVKYKHKDEEDLVIVSKKNDDPVHKTRFKECCVMGS